MLVIHPDECIDCGVCEPECPVEAIKPDTEAGAEKWLKLNARLRENLAEYYGQTGSPRLTLRSGRASRTNSNTSRRIPARVIEPFLDAPSRTRFRRIGCPSCLPQSLTGRSVH